MPLVEVPGHGDVEFPDDMNDQQIADAIKKNMGPKQPDTWGQAIKNVAQGGAHFATGAVGSVAGNVAGLASLMAPPAMIARKLGYEGGILDPANVREKVSNALTYTPDNQDTVSMRVANAIPNALHWTGQQLKKPVEGIPYLETLAENLPEVGANAIGLKGGRAIARGPKPAEVPIPTTEQLRTASSAAYDASEKAGVVLNPESTLRVVDMMQRVADSENLGKLPPKIKEASDILTARLDAGKPLKLKDADKVRQLINDAKKSTDAADQRLAGIIQGEYDQYLVNLGHEDVIAGNKDAGLTALIEARDLFKRSKNSQMLDDMEHDAGLTGSTNYSQAGVELAMRREFLRLAKNDREMRKLTPEQRAAVEKVAAPGKGANTLRNIGKFDPTRGGIPAFMASVLGSGGGAAVAGPVGAIAGPALLGTAAHLANRGAARITRNNVAGAREALVGRGLPNASTNAIGVSKRGATQIFQQMQGVDAELAALPKTEPFDSPRRKALEQKAQVLRAELTLAVSTASSRQ